MDILRLTGWVFLFFFCFAFVSLVTRTDRAQTKKVGGHWVPQLRSLPAILARGLRIRPAHSPVPPTLNWLVDKSMVAVPNTVRGKGGRDR